MNHKYFPKIGDHGGGDNSSTDMSSSMSDEPPKTNHSSKPILKRIPFAGRLTLPGKDPFSKLANDAIDEGDDLIITDSFLPAEENSSVIGNSSVDPRQKNPSQAQSTPTGNTDTSTQSSYIRHPKYLKNKNQMTSRLFLTRKVRRIKDKVSRIAFPGQDFVSKSANDTLNDGDDLFISSSFQPVEDVSSLSGNYSSADPFQKKVNQLESLAEESIGWVDRPKSITNSYREHNKPFIKRLPSKGKAALALPGKVIRSSQKILPWRLNSLHMYRPGAENAYQEFREANAANPETLMELDAAFDRRQVMQQKKSRMPANLGDLDIRQTNSSDSDITRGRCLTVDNASCSGMSDITEDTFYSKSRSFRLAHSMYVVQTEENILVENSDGFDDDATRDSLVSPINRKNDKLEPSNVPESKEMVAFDSDENYTREAVNGFLNQIAVQGTDQWETFFLPGKGQLDTTHRHRIFSDSDVVFENQRQRVEKGDIGSSEAPQMSILLKDIVSSYEGDEKIDKDEGKIPSEFITQNTEQEAEIADRDLLAMENNPIRSRVFSDDQYDYHLFSSKKTLIASQDDSKSTQTYRRPRFSSEPTLGTPKGSDIKETTNTGKNLTSKAKSALKKVQNAALQQLSAISPGDALSVVRNIAADKSDYYYWFESESDSGSPTEEEVLWFPDDALEDIL